MNDQSSWRITRTTANDMSFGPCLTSHSSISYLLAELFDFLVHKLGSPKCVVAGISVPWPALWTTALPMTASCLSTLSEFESLLGHERLMPLT